MGKGNATFSLWETFEKRRECNGEAAGRNGRDGY